MCHHANCMTGTPGCDGRSVRYVSAVAASRHRSHSAPKTCVRIVSHHCHMSYTLRFEDKHAWLLHADPLHPTCCAGCVAVLGAVLIVGTTQRSILLSVFNTPFRLQLRLTVIMKKTYETQQKRKQDATRASCTIKSRLII